MDTFEIKNNQGDYITLSNYGARIIKWLTDVEGEPRNIVLGYEKLEDYLQDDACLGAIVGPFANRIANAECVINDEKIQFSANEGNNLLHGGALAFADQVWEIDNHTENSLTLSCKLPDNHNGFPGDILAIVNYEITDKSALIISMDVESQKVTIAGPTSHPYFNLNPQQKSIQHSLKVNGHFYTPFKRDGIPSGEVIAVKNSIHDFTAIRPIHKQKSDGEITEVKHIDNNFLVSLTDTTTSEAMFSHAMLVSEDNKVTLHASSNYPAIQVYNGQYLPSPFTPNQGVCLEPQFCPNSPNQQNFPFHLTTPDAPLKTKIIYQLKK